MAPQPKIFILLVVLAFPRDITPVLTLKADDLGTHYDNVIMDGGEQYWTKRFFGDGFGIASALSSISNEKALKQRTVCMDISSTPIFIFASYGAKGRGLLASALKLINDGYRYFNIVFIIDYFDPASPASIVCRKILNDIENLAKVREANVKIYRLHIPDGCSELAHHLPAIREIEKLAQEAGVMTTADGQLYPVVGSLVGITDGKLRSEILVDGIAGVQFTTFATDRRGLPTDPRLITIHAAIFFFADVAQQGPQSGATVVVNVLPSGMDKDTGAWLAGDTHRFPFNFVLSPGWPITATESQIFRNVSNYWIFFKLPQMVPAHIFQHDRCMPPPPGSTLFQIMYNSLAKIVRQTQAHQQLLNSVKLLQQSEKKKSFMLYIIE